MPRILGLSLWLAVVLLLVGSTHYYIWARLVRDVAMPMPWSAAATVLVCVLAVGLPASMILARLGSGPWVRVVVRAAFVWMGMFFILLCLLAATDAMWAMIYVARHVTPLPWLDDPAHGQLLARIFANGVVIWGTFATLSGLRIASRGPEVTRVTVHLKRLPRSMHGFTIVQISDLHVAALLGREYVERVVEKANAIKPSLIAVTGDLVDGTVEQLRHAAAPLAQLQATHGVFFVTGNHEYYSGVDAWIAEVGRLGMRVLRNERVSVGEGADSFDLAGIDDWTARAFGQGHGANLRAAVADRDPKRELVLLAHQPKAVFEAAEHGVGLMLSGHTHGGQIWPFGYLVRLAQPYVQGLAWHGPTQIYVNRGTGYWGPPMRLGAPPELTLLELRAPD